MHMCVADMNPHEVQAEDYDLYAVPQYEDGENLISLIKQFSPNKANRVILDLGCGTGSLIPQLVEFAGEGGRVIGVDPDEERLAKAQVKHEGKFSNVEFLKGSWEDIPRPDQGLYDLVFANHVLNWITDLASLFKIIYENLKPGGLFTFVVAIKELAAISELLSLVDPKVEEAIRQNFKSKVPPEVYTDMAVSHGFTITYQVAESKECVFPHVDHLIRWLFATTDGKYCGLNVDKLEHFKQQFGNTPVRGDLAKYVRGTFIFTKP